MCLLKNIWRSNAQQTLMIMHKSKCFNSSGANLKEARLNEVNILYILDSHHVSQTSAKHILSFLIVQ